MGRNGDSIEIDGVETRNGPMSIDIILWPNEAGWPKAESMVRRHEVLGSASILAAKLASGRGKLWVPRDVYDFAVATKREPSAAHDAMAALTDTEIERNLAAAGNRPGALSRTVVEGASDEEALAQGRAWPGGELPARTGAAGAGTKQGGTPRQERKAEPAPGRTGPRVEATAHGRNVRGV